MKYPFTVTAFRTRRPGGCELGVSRSPIDLTQNVARQRRYLQTEWQWSVPAKHHSSTQRPRLAAHLWVQRALMNAITKSSGHVWLHTYVTGHVEWSLSAAAG
jgi:hypothetical protein